MLFAEIACDVTRHKLERLYDRYAVGMRCEAMFILSDKQLAEDAVHESFIRIMRNLHKINEKDISRTKYFLNIICRNVAKDLLKSRLPLTDEGETEDMVPAERFERRPDNPAEIASYNELVTYTKEALKRISKNYSDAFMLNKFYGYSCEEIGEMLGIGREAAKKRVTRASQRVREILIEEGIIDERQ